MLCRAILAGCLLVAGAPAFAADAPPSPAAPAGDATSAASGRRNPVATPPGPAADAAVAAASDPARLRALARKADPDPWCVVDVLRARGRLDVAKALAAAYAGEDAAALAAFAASPPAEDATARARLDAARAPYLSATQDAEVVAGLAGLGTPPGVVGVVAALLRGGALVHLTRVAEATPELEAAVARAAALGWVRGEMLALATLGIAAFESGAYEVALAAFERRCAYDERTGNTTALGISLGNVANAQKALGDLEGARANLERAIELRRATGKSAALANAIGNLAALWHRLGDYPKSLRLYREATDCMRAAGDRAGAARLLGNLASLQALLGAVAKAYELYERALAEHRALGNEAGTGFILSSLGELDASLGRTELAVVRLEQALAVHRRLGQRDFECADLLALADVARTEGDAASALARVEEAAAVALGVGDPALLGDVLLRRGRLHGDAGRYDAAVADLEASAKAFERGRSRTGTVAATVALGRVALARGDLKAAARHADRAAREAERLRADRHLVLAQTLKAEVRLARDDHGAALEVARQATAVVDRIFAGLGGEQAAAARETVASVYALGARAAALADDPADLAYFVENGRAGALVESLAARDVALGADLPDELRRERDAARAEETAAAAAHARALSGDDLKASRAAAAALDAARGRSLLVAERIERTRRRGDVWDHRGATLDEVAVRLGPKEAWVSFAWADPDVIALVVTVAEARVVRLGTAADVVAACEALTASDPDADVGPALARLDELVVRPLGLTPATPTVLVSPEGPLCYVPFAALLRGRDVAYLPSGTTWLHLLDHRAAPGQRVLAVGDPSYDASRGPGALARLPHTREEVLTVGDVTLLGADATEAGLRRALAGAPRWKAVHLACHGLVDRDEPRLSSLALVPGGDDDGFLTAAEVLELDVRSDLVVLSACETGAGKVRRGEGLSGLMRSFLFAGTPRVVCSLWKVDDEATRALMVRFYELWNPKPGTSEAAGPALTAAEALRAAQEHVRAQPRWRHPYFWAAWVLWGRP